MDREIVVAELLSSYKRMINTLLETLHQVEWIRQERSVICPWCNTEHLDQEEDNDMPGDEYDHRLLWTHDTGCAYWQAIREYRDLVAKENALQ